MIHKFNKSIIGQLCIIDDPQNLIRFYRRYNINLINNDHQDIYMRITYDYMDLKNITINVLQSCSKEYRDNIYKHLAEIEDIYSDHINAMDKDYVYHKKFTEHLLYKKKCRLISIYLKVIEEYSQLIMQPIKEYYNCRIFTNIVNMHTIYNPLITIITTEQNIPLNLMIHSIFIFYDYETIQEFINKTVRTPSMKNKLLRITKNIINFDKIVIYHDGEYYWDNP